LAASEDLDIQATGQGELALAHKPNRIKDLEDEHDFLAGTFGFETTLLKPEELQQRGWQAANAYSGHWVPVGFGLHPLRYARSLADAAVRRGAIIHGHSAVTGWETRGGKHRLITAGGSVTADKVIIATNGYTPEYLHAGLMGRTLPVLTNIIVTRPLTDGEQAAQGWTETTPSVDTLKLLHYFRLLPDGRFLFGGRGGLDARPEAAAVMRAKLTREFAAMFPAWRDADITHFWRGFVNMAADWVPHAGLLPGETTVYAGLAYHGSGVAMGTWTGRALAGLATGTTQPPDLPATMARPLPRYPFSALRPWYLKAAYTAYGFKDRWL
jgi:glycine/D-amino acid oxidase-like deaminating enzyme